MQWIEAASKELDRMDEQFESDEPYFEAGEDLGRATEIARRLIHAVKVAEKALVHIIHEVRGNGRNLTGAEIHVEDYAVKKLAQLQSGEFGEVSK